MTQLPQNPQKNKNLDPKTISNIQKNQSNKVRSPAIFAEIYKKLASYSPIKNLPTPDPQYSENGHALPLYPQIGHYRYKCFEDYSRQEFETYLIQGYINLEIEIDVAFSHSPSRAAKYLLHIANFSTQAASIFHPNVHRYIDSLMAGWGDLPQQESDLVLHIIAIAIRNLAPDLETMQTNILSETTSLSQSELPNSSPCQKKTIKKRPKNRFRQFPSKPASQRSKYYILEKKYEQKSPAFAANSKPKKPPDKQQQRYSLPRKPAIVIECKRKPPDKNKKWAPIPNRCAAPHGIQNSYQYKGQNDFYEISDSSPSNSFMKAINHKIPC